MKTIFRLLCGWMAIALAACTGDELQQIEPLKNPVAQKTISVKAYTPSEQAATRLAFEDKGAEGLKLSWTTGDAFTALINNNKVPFTYDEDSKEFTANVAQDVTLTDGLKAYYPAYDGENFEMDFSQQTGQLNGATTYMEGVYEGDAFSFNHSTAILKATFSDLPQNAVISSIQISGAVDITISNPNASISKDAVYINLPAIAKDTELKFTITTTDSEVYTATKTVKAVEGIKTGVYYNTTVELQEACLLPTGGEFKSAVISFLQSNSSLTKIKFIAKSPATTKSGTNDENATEDYSYRLVADSDNETLEIHTSAAEFVFNADCNSMFAGLSAITAIDFNNCINTANVTIMNAMFQNCSSLTSLDLSSFNTANVTNMAFMFQVCSELTSLNVSSFNTANVTDMNAMFQNCSSLTSLDLSSFNTENVEYMSSMFVECFALTSLDLSSFNTEKVEYMSSMFASCLALESLDVSSFDFGNVTDFENMFYDLGSEATNSPIPVYVTQAGYNILTNVKNTGIVSDTQYVPPCHLPVGIDFNNAVNSFLESNPSLTKIKFIAKSDVGDSEETPPQIGECGAYMVAGSDTLEIHTSGAEFVFNADCFGMFDGYNSSNYSSNNIGSKITSIDFNNCINTANVTDMSSMFKNCSSLQSITFGNSFNTSNVTNMGYMFYGCSALESLDLSSFNTSNAMYMNHMFNSCSALTSLDLSSFNTSKVTDMNFMFYGCSALESLNVSSFNTSNVTDMCNMFDGCKKLTSLNVSRFNTAKVTDMSYMFSRCSALTSLDLRSFITANVTNMTYMFRLCSALTSLNVSRFNTANVTDMSNMFVGCYSLESLDLSRFDFGKVANFSGMFTDLGKNVNPTLVYIYVKDVNDKQKLDNANTGITPSRVIIFVKQP